MVDLIRAEVAQVVEQQTEDPLPRQALVGVAQSATLCNQAVDYSKTMNSIGILYCSILTFSPTSRFWYTQLGAIEP